MAFVSFRFYLPLSVTLREICFLRDLHLNLPNRPVVLTVKVENH